MLLGGAGLVLGAAATESANLLGGGGSPSRIPVPPGESLMYEHGVLKRVLMVYTAAAGILATDPGRAMHAIEGGAGIIHDYIEDFHEAIEEGYVFPALVRAGQLTETVDTLLLQHARGRQITQVLLSASTTPVARVTAAVNAFVRMYTPHEAREDTVIFPALRAISSQAQLDEIGGRITELQDQQFGPSGFADTVTRVAALERSLGIYDLEQFTPAEVT